MRQTWWYVLAGGFGVRNFVARDRCTNDEARQQIAAAEGVPPQQVEQCWRFDKAVDTYHQSWYRK